MSSIEIMALAVSAAILLKLVVVWFNPKQWAGVTKAILSHSAVTTVIYLALSLYLAKLVFASFTIVEVMGMMAFFSVLMGLGILPYSKEVVKFQEEILKTKDVFKRAWLSVIIWLGLALWTLKELFM